MSFNVSIIRKISYNNIYFNEEYLFHFPSLIILSMQDINYQAFKVILLVY